MQAIVFADRGGVELEPLNDQFAPAMLPVANKPLLQYTIEDLASAGVEEVFVVISAGAQEVEEYFTDGAMWGIRIRYLLSRGEECVDRLVLRLGSQLKAPYLAMRGDVLRSASCRDFLEKASEVSSGVAMATMNRKPAAMCLVHETPDTLCSLNWPQCHLASCDDLPCAVIDLEHGQFSALKDLADFHQAALSVAQDFSNDGQLLHRQLAAGLWVDRLAEVSPRSVVSGDVIIGRDSLVHKTARLSGPCVIESDCYIDRRANISNSIIMPGTYLGEKVQVEHAIVTGNTLLRVDLGIKLRLEEPQMLSAIQDDVRALFGAWPHRIMGLLLLLISLPLWPLAMLLALIQSPEQPMRKRTFLSNLYQGNGNERHRKIVSAREFVTFAPMLRQLPLLLLVISGDLRLFGTRPLEANELGIESSWYDQRQQYPSSGLLGPAQLTLPREAPEEEIRLAEIEFIAKSGLPAFIGSLFRAARAAFSPRAWWSFEKTGEA